MGLQWVFIVMWSAYGLIGAAIALKNTDDAKKFGIAAGIALSLVTFFYIIFVLASLTVPH